MSFVYILAYTFNKTGLQVCNIQSQKLVRHVQHKLKAIDSYELSYIYAFIWQLEIIIYLCFHFIYNKWNNGNQYEPKFPFCSVLQPEEHLSWCVR